MESISVFLPAHNEEENIGKMLRDSVSFLEKSKRDYELIVIADHCTDDTERLVTGAANKNSRIRLVINDGIAGYGSALKKGFASATKELIFFTDADLQFSMKDLAKMFPLIETYDYIIGYRIDRKDSAYRSFNGHAWTFLIKIILGVDVKDIDCAFKLFKRDAIESIDIKSNTALINAEILYKLQQKGYTWKEIGVHHYERKYGTPTGAHPLVILKAFRDLMKLKLNNLS